MTIFSLYRSNTVEAAVNAWQKATGGTATYSWALEEGSEDGFSTVTGSREDALTQLNTQLLAGSGPDVLILDDMPVDSFIEKGLLMDLSGKVDTSGMLENMTGVWQTEQGPVRPARPGVPAAGGDGRSYFGHHQGRRDAGGAAGRRTQHR